ncbi:MAG: hypothetical protein JNM40_02415 [Myxococcales bacterium]|nr:hypothetical protein [Myxococcales bacterium]
MSERRSTESLDIEGLLPPLDDQPGPAPPLSAVAQAALIEQALHKGSTIPVQSLRRGLIFGGAAAITGAVSYLLFRRWIRIPKTMSSPTTGAESAPVFTAQPEVRTKPGVEARTKTRSEAITDSASSHSTQAKKSDSRSAHDLLRIANERRRKQRFAEALQIYQQIVQQDPTSEEGYVARVAAGGLLLEKKKQPQAALRMFRSALRTRPQGTLAEEARLGICDALAQQSDRAAEAQAIREFLAHHSDSPARARMEVRLRQATERTTQ